MSKIIVSQGNKKLNVNKEFLAGLNSFNDLLVVDDFIDKDKDIIKIFNEEFQKIPVISVREHFIWSNKPIDMNSFWVLSNNQGELLAISDSLYQHINKFSDILTFSEVVNNAVKENVDNIPLFEELSLNKEDMLGTEYCLFSYMIKAETEAENIITQSFIETKEALREEIVKEEQNTKESNVNNNKTEEVLDKTIESNEDEKETVYEKQIEVKKKPKIIVPEFNISKEEE